jgi:type II secretory pathway pseudopilin PulG
MIEILVVLGIIALLVGMLLPAVHAVQKMAKETKQKAQLTAIEFGLAAFKNDYGDYPPSDWWNPAVAGGRQDYCGAQKLAEALLGWDLLGFHPNSAWLADGLDRSGAPTVYTAPNSLEKRKERYVELETAGVFRLGESAPGARDGLFVDTGVLSPYTHVLCDVFSVNERKIVLGSGKTVSPGTPILYYKANPASKIFPAVMNPGAAVLEPLEGYIYNGRDNWPLLSLGKLKNTGRLPAGAPTNVHPLEGAGVGWGPFYLYVRDPKVQARAWPCRPDSYILISAGADGLYGTNDDICNFGR